MTTDARCLVRFIGTMLLALLLGQWLSPARLRADCGEHVHFTKLRTQGQAPAGRESDLTSLPFRGSEPECSNHDELPLTPVAPQVNDFDRWGCLMPVPTARPHGPGWRVHYGAIPLLPRHPARIFHPPRR